MLRAEAPASIARKKTLRLGRIWARMMKSESWPSRENLASIGEEAVEGDGRDVEPVAARRSAGHDRPYALLHDRSAIAHLRSVILSNTSTWLNFCPLRLVPSS